MSKFAVFVPAILLLSSYFLWSKKDTLSPERLTIADADQIVFALVYIADAQGYFKDEGLDVSYRKFKSGNDALADVLEGNSDIATVYQTPVVADVLAGKPVRVLSTLHRSNKNTAMVVRKDMGIASYADLRGKRIAVTKGTYQANLLNMLLEDEQITPAMVTVVDMYHQDMPAALAAGSVDAAVTRWPYIGIAQQQSPPGSTLVLTSPMYNEVSLLASTDDTVGKRKEAFSRLMRALVKAEDYVARHDDAAFEIAISHWLRPATADDRKIWDQVQLQLRVDNTLLQAMENEAAWFVRHNANLRIPSSLKVFIDSNFLEAVRPQFVLIGNFE
ncbi:MAG: NrtA/SsuA/CpmA family ABC transporter substrate-binding protein [Gallionella sp.]